MQCPFLIHNALSVDNPGDWDSPISFKLIKEWSTAIKEGITQDSLWFPCSIMNSKAVKNLRLVWFWDRSSQAFSTIIYSVTVVSKTKDNDQGTLPDGDLDNRDFDPK